MSALAWCPWCRDDASANGARVSVVAAPRGAGGCALTPWDGGGWECAECGARAPRQAWAQAQRWQEASDAQRARAEAAEAEVARLRALLDADPVGGRWRRRARAWAERIARAESERDDARAIVGEAMAAGLAECDRLRESLRWYWNERAELLRAIPRD